MAEPKKPISDADFMKQINQHPAIAQILKLAESVDRGERTPEEAMQAMERNIGRIEP